MSYRNLHIWELSRKSAIEIHRMTMKLPTFEFYETGSQIRRSSKSVKSNIVEGYGRRRYLKEYIRFLVFAQASNDETLDHLETLFQCQSLKDTKSYQELRNTIVLLGKKINLFIQTLDQASNQ